MAVAKFGHNTGRFKRSLALGQLGKKTYYKDFNDDV